MSELASLPTDGARVLGANEGWPHPGKSGLCRLAAACRFCVGTSLYALALSKAARPEEAVAALSALGLGGDIPFWLLVLGELLLGSALVAGWQRRACLAATCGLLSIFLGWQTFLWLSGSALPCGCGKPNWVRAALPGRAGDVMMTLALLATSTFALVCGPSVGTASCLGGASHDQSLPS